MNCPVLSFLEMREFDMNHTRLISLVSAIHSLKKSKNSSLIVCVCLFVCSSRRYNRHNLVFFLPYNLKLNELI